jgi:hypothetical protein
VAPETLALDDLLGQMDFDDAFLCHGWILSCGVWRELLPWSGSSTWQDP